MIPGRDHHLSEKNTETFDANSSDSLTLKDPYYSILFGLGILGGIAAGVASLVLFWPLIPVLAATAALPVITFIAALILITASIAMPIFAPLTLPPAILAFIFPQAAILTLSGIIFTGAAAAIGATIGSALTGIVNLFSPKTRAESPEIDPFYSLAYYDVKNENKPTLECRHKPLAGNVLASNNKIDSRQSTRFFTSAEPLQKDAHEYGCTFGIS